MKINFTTFAVILFISIAARGNPCETVADADQQFITELCEANAQFKDRPSHMGNLCSPNFISESKKAVKNRPFSYKEGGKDAGFSKYKTYENISYEPVVFSMACTTEGLALETLIINHEQLRVIPESLGGLKYLKILDLVDNAIIHVPDSLCQLQNLEQLRLSFNQIPLIPDYLDEMPNLYLLELDGNQVYTVDADYMSRLMQKKMQLNLTENNIPGGEKRKLRLQFSGYADLTF